VSRDEKRQNKLNNQKMQALTYERALQQQKKSKDNPEIECSCAPEKEYSNKMMASPKQMPLLKSKETGAPTVWRERLRRLPAGGKRKKKARFAS
jgi:hypothetical protein